MTNDALIGPVAAPELHVMTYNIRRMYTFRPRKSPDRWDTRKPLLRRILAMEQPTILGVQEALPGQVGFIADALGPDYRFVSRSRKADGSDEHCPLYYDARRLELTDWRQLALSATPDAPGSRSWGNFIPRIVTSAEFTDIATGHRVLAYNTHLDHLSKRSRLESAAMITALASAAHLDDPVAMILVTGDMNAGASSTVHDRFTAGGFLRDAWEVAVDRLTPQWGTFSNYRPPHPGGKRIDVIFVGPGVDALRCGINAARFAGRAASDHEPVQAVLRPTVLRPTPKST